MLISGGDDVSVLASSCLNVSSCCCCCFVLQITAEASFSHIAWPYLVVIKSLHWLSLSTPDRSSFGKSSSFPFMPQSDKRSSFRRILKRLCFQSVSTTEVSLCPAPWETPGICAERSGEFNREWEEAAWPDIQPRHYRQIFLADNLRAAFRRGLSMI